MNPIALRLNTVTKRFGNRTILDSFSLEVKKGEILVIIGQSGVGKSVTLKHWVGLLAPDSGEVWVGEIRVDGADPKTLQKVRARCGYVFQQPALLDSLTLRANLLLAGGQSRDRLDAVLSSVSLDPSLLDRFPPTLSYGMQKRASIARTLMTSPEILLFDEPTTGLDPGASISIHDLICSLSRTFSVTTVMVSHDLEQALRIADRILILEGGRAALLDTPDRIKKSGHPLVEAFLVGQSGGDA